VPRLSKTRRKRPVPEDWATGESIQAFQPSETSDPVSAGGKSLSTDASGDLVLVGGSSGAANVYSLSSKQVVRTLEGNGGSVTDAVWVADNAAVAASTGAVRIYENGAEAAAFNSHAGEVTALAVHPTGDILASVGVDKSYVLYDLTTSSTIAQVFTDAGKSSSLGTYVYPFHLSPFANVC
jgi:pre-mRNA-processing factor 19